MLLVKPTYKDGWEIPGGYVEKGESPLAAATREVTEELGIMLDISELWAPHPAECDRLLFIFRAENLRQDEAHRLTLASDEIADARFSRLDDLPNLLPDRLARRVDEAARRVAGIYLEHGRRPSPPPQGSDTAQLSPV